LFIVYGTDYTGTVCGSTTRAGLTYIAYPRLQTDFIMNLAVSDPLNYNFYGICVNSCPNALDVVCNYNIPTGTFSNNFMLSCFQSSNAANCTQVKSNCWVTPVTTTSSLYRCMPIYNATNSAFSTCIFPSSNLSSTDPACVIAQQTKTGTTTFPAQQNQVYQLMGTVRQTLGRYFGDLVRSWWVLLLCSVGVTAVFAFFWLILAKWCTSIFVWGTISLVILLLVGLTVFFYDVCSFLYQIINSLCNF
jgi:hypothetical protein